MSSARLLVVVARYDRRPIEDLERLRASMEAHPPGLPHDVLLVVNRETDAPLPSPPGVEVVARENLGMNIGAWEHGRRARPGYDGYLFLQDDCFVVRDGWLAAFAEAAAAPGVGMVGESLNEKWEADWETLRKTQGPARLPGHGDGNRVDLYLDHLRRWGVDPGPTGRHLRSLVWFLRREVLDRIGGFPIGRSKGECIAAEISVSRRIEALGLRLREVGPEPFHFIRHREWVRERSGGPFRYAPVQAGRPPERPGGRDAVGRIEGEP